MNTPREKKTAAFQIPPDSRPAGCKVQTQDPEGQDFKDMKVAALLLQPCFRSKWYKLFVGKWCS